MEQRFAAPPGGKRRFGRLVDIERIAVAPVVVGIIDERHALGAADWKQIGRGECLVVVFDRKQRTGGFAEEREIPGEACKRRGFVAIPAAAVDVNRIGVSPRREHRLRLEVGDGVLHDNRIRRVKDYKLVRVKPGAHTPLARERAARAILRDDRVASGKVPDAVAGLRVCDDGKDRAGDAERADAVRRAEPQCCEKCVCVVRADIGKFRETRALWQREQRSRSRRAKGDGLVRELTAQTESKRMDRGDRSLGHARSVDDRVPSDERSFRFMRRRHA